MFPFSPGFYSPGFSSLMGFLLSWFLFFSGFSDLTVDLLSWLSTLLVYLSSVLYSPGFSLFCIFYSPGFYFFLFFFSSGFFSLLNSPSFWFLASSVVFKCFFPHEFCFSYALLFFLSIRSILRFQFSFDFRTGNLERFILLLQ